MRTEILSFSQLERAAEIITSGGVVALRTETVWGLCANGLDKDAIRRVFEAKGRPENKPVSLFVRDMAMAETLCKYIPKSAFRLAEAFWPGQLTLVLRKRARVPEILAAGGASLGVRCPGSPEAMRLMELTGLPLTGTSANLTGRPSAVSFGEALAAFDGRIAAVIRSDEPCGGLPSTFLDLTGREPRILRQGGVTAEEIERVLRGR